MATPIDIFHAKILVVDDKAANVALLANMLRGAGYTSIDSTMDPFKVRDMHEAKRYDLILLDLQMPGMDGFMVMEALKEVEADAYLPVLVVTAQPDHKIRALQAGAKDFVSKPFELLEVLTRVRNMIEVRLLHNEAVGHAKALKQNLLEATARLDRIGQAAKVGLWQWDLRTGAIEFSPECRHQIGYGDNELADNLDEWRERIHPDDLDNVLTFSKKYIESQECGFTLEFRLRHQDGSYCWILAQGSILADREGQPERFLCSHINITERKRLEEQFHQAQKMESVGRLAGGIAHDFNNLLSVIIGYADFALEIVAAEEPLKEDLEQILRAGNRAAELTQQLLAFSRKQVLRPGVLNLSDVVAKMMKMLSRLIPESIDLVYVPPAQLGNIQGDAGQIEQVIVNLVVNASDSMPQGGTLTLESHDETLLDSVVQRDALMVPIPPGDYVVLQVSDSGCGMDAATARQIFEPFFTTKEVGKGTGLGLATVYGIVRQSSGCIQVKSKVGEGTTFKIFFPRVEAELPVAQPVRKETRNQGSGVIVLVEDDEALRLLGTRILRHAGYTVISASGGIEALNMLATDEQQVRLLITDVVMPHMSGPELSQRVNDMGRRTKTLYMSGYADSAGVRDSVFGANASFLAKPFTAEALTQKVHELLNVIAN